MRTDLYKLSQEMKTNFPDLLWQYVAEDLFWRLEKTGLIEKYKIKNQDYLEKKKIVLFQTTDKNNSPERLHKVFEEESDIEWSGSFEEGKWRLSAKYINCDHNQISPDIIEIPFQIEIHRLMDEGLVSPTRVEIEFINRKHKKIVMNSYSIETILGEHIFEIMRKLELINDMKSYEVVFSILSSNSISGRRIIEIFEVFSTKEPKVISKRRLEQIEEYKTYSYMKKRWNQHAKRRQIQCSWEEVVDKILSFIKPLWTAMCNNEIFFDDWMPELGRFLG